MNEQLQNETLQKAGFGRRLGAFLIDHIALSIILVFGFIFLTIDDPFMMFSLMPWFMLVALAVYCCKDIIGGASLGKRAMGLTVRCGNNPEAKPTIPRLLLRNIFTFLWPVEAIVLLATPDKRKLGDMIANTDVYIKAKKAKRVPTWIIVIATIAVFMFTMVIGVTVIIRGHESFSVATAHIEANEEIRDIIGDVTGFGFFVSGGVSASPGRGNADFSFRVFGEDGSLNVRIVLERIGDGDWQVIHIFH